MTPARPWSLRRRLSRRVLTLVLGAWLGTIALATAFLDHETNEMLDEELSTVAETTVLYMDATPGEVIPRNIGIAPENGERVLRILRQGDPVPDTPWPVLTSDGFHDANGWRVLRISAEHAVIEVAHLQAWRHEEVLEAASAFLVLILPMGALLLWGLRHSLRQAFAPMERLADQIAQRRPSDLSPLDGMGLPSELAPLAAGLNSYVARIDDLRQAERQFVANAAHELRTPVAAIRARLDLSPDDEARAALPMLDNLTRRVERLLQLSRSEAGLGLGTGPTDLVRVTQLLIRETAGQSERPIRFDDGDLDRLMIAADPDAVAILIRNLLENAVEHGTGTVEVALTAEGQLSITNPAKQAAFHETAFAKRAGSSGSGLGLTIVAQLACALEVPVEKQITDGTAKVCISFRPLREA